MTPPEETSAFKPINNPFYTGNPVRDRNLFFGREDNFAYLEQLQQKYDAANQLLSSGALTYHIYHQNRIAFALGPDNQVQRWTLY